MLLAHHQEHRGMMKFGFKIRTRALTTTMFARLCLADLFIHGIGGGIYDELTDGIIQNYFQMSAPGFLVLSATLLLPLPRYPEAAQQARILARRGRDLLYKPELFAERTAEVAAMIRAKQAWIASPIATHDQRTERFAQIRVLNARLAPFVQLPLMQTQTKLEECQRLVAVNEVASRRDYAFCLYPEEMLRTFFAEVIR